MGQLIVQKYGGSSVADPEKIKNVARRVAESAAPDHRMVVVVSAMGKTTDGLLALAAAITSNPDPREMDMLLATGEQVTVGLLAMALQSLGRPACSFTGPQVGLYTDEVHTRARQPGGGDCVAELRALAELLEHRTRRARIEHQDAVVVHHAHVQVGRLRRELRHQALVRSDELCWITLEGVGTEEHETGELRRRGVAPCRGGYPCRGRRATSASPPRRWRGSPPVGG